MVLLQKPLRGVPGKRPAIVEHVSYGILLLGLACVFFYVVSIASQHGIEHIVQFDQIAMLGVIGYRFGHTTNYHVFFE